MTDTAPTFELETIFPDEEEPTENNHAGVKKFAKLVVSSSVKFVVTSTIVSLVPTETRLQKGKLLVGSYVLSGILADKAKDYISDDLDKKFQYAREVLVYAKKLSAKQDETDTVNP